MEGYLGAAVSGFPNFFSIIGPNSAFGHTSVLVAVEAQVRYILSAIREIGDRRLKFVDLRPEVQADYNEQLDRRHSRLVWQTGGCASFYKKAERNWALFPGFSFEFIFRTRRFDRAAYEVVAEGERSAPVSVRTRESKRSVAAAVESEGAE
jgi:hypothetical protein